MPCESLDCPGFQTLLGLPTGNQHRKGRSFQMNSQASLCAAGGFGSVSISLCKRIFLTCSLVVLLLHKICHFPQLPFPHGCWGTGRSSPGHVPPNAQRSCSSTCWSLGITGWHLLSLCSPGLVSFGQF